MNKIPYVYSGFRTHAEAYAFQEKHGGEVMVRPKPYRGEYDEEESAEEQICVVRYE